MTSGCWSCYYVSNLVFAFFFLAAWARLSAKSTIELPVLYAYFKCSISLSVWVCVLPSTVCIVATFESHYTFDKTAHFIIKFLIQSTIDTPTIQFNSSCSYFTHSLSMPKLFGKRTTIINPGQISTQFCKIEFELVELCKWFVVRHIYCFKY